MSRVTIADVARAAEVSTATVSNALNGTGRLSAATRSRVRAVAADLGYGSLAAAPALAVAATGSAIGHTGAAAYFSRLAAAATEAAHRRGYALFVMPADAAAAHWRTLPVAGALFLDVSGRNPAVGVLRTRGLPLVFDGRPAEEHRGENWVDNDYAAATRSALDHLASRGARSVALGGCPRGDPYTRLCRETYRAWCADRRVEPRVLRMDARDPEGRLLDPLLAPPSRPDAVHGLCDACGHRLVASARRVGVPVPDRLLLSCLSTGPGPAPLPPTVTRVTLTPDRLGRAAIGALTALVEDPRTARPARLLPTRLHPSGRG
ncbi:LacI family DNA-binding transcriptional regulator [Streptomyces sp. NPDC058417]|uniref:LacI family DNA-binding transcriptional regulator n=2 Tax=Streptomyces TaxID=1883 RepID=UPI0036518A82